MAYCMGSYCCTKHYVNIRNDSVSGSQSTELGMIYLKNTTRSLIMSSPNRSEGWDEERNLLSCGTGSSCLLCYTHRVLCILWAVVQIIAVHPNSHPWCCPIVYNGSYYLLKQDTCYMCNCKDVLRCLWYQPKKIPSYTNWENNSALLTLFVCKYI